MGRKKTHSPVFHEQAGILQVICIHEGHPEYGSHRGSYHFWIIYICRIMIHNNAGDTSALSCPDYGTKVSGVLYRLQYHDGQRPAVWCWFYNVIHGIALLPHHGQHSLGRLRICHNIHDHIADCLRPEPPHPFPVISVPCKVLRNIQGIHILRVQLPAHSEAFHHIHALFPPGLCFASQAHNTLYLLV